MDATEWFAFVREVGVFAAATSVFIWWSWLRELRLANRITELEKFVENTLMTALRENTIALQNCGDAMEHVTATLKDLTEATRRLERATDHLGTTVNFRPCLLPENHPAKKAAAEELQKALAAQEAATKINKL